jgi:hypothetical protein
VLICLSWCVVFSLLVFYVSKENKTTHQHTTREHNPPTQTRIRLESTYIFNRRQQLRPLQKKITADDDHIGRNMSM